MNGNLPSIFYSFFQRNINIHTYFTRRSNYLHVPLMKTEYSQRTVRYTGVNLWNRHISKIDPECTIIIYKQNIKNYLNNHDVNLNP